MTVPSEDHLDLDAPIWGAANFAPIIGRTVAQTHYLLERGELDATKKGRLYVSTKRRLRKSLGISASGETAAA